MCLLRVHLPAGGDNLTGTATFAENATSKCKHGAASAEMYGGLEGPSFRPNATGSLSVTYQWHVAAGPGGSGFYTIDLELVGNLYDNTTHAWALNASAVELLAKVTCGPMGCTYFGGFGPLQGMNATTWLNFSAPVTAGQSYLFYTYLVGSVSVSNCGVSRGGHVTCLPVAAHLDLASPGEGATIVAMRAS